MKQGTVKTLGVAALGAAFAVVATGTASAATPTDTLRTLPVQDVAGAVSASTPKALDATQHLLVAGTSRLQQPTTKSESGYSPEVQAAKGVAGMIGGLPLGTSVRGGMLGA